MVCRLLRPQISKEPRTNMPIQHDFGPFVERIIRYLNLQMHVVRGRLSHVWACSSPVCPSKCLKTKYKNRCRAWSRVNPSTDSSSQPITGVETHLTNSLAFRLLVFAATASNRGKPGACSTVEAKDHCKCQKRREKLDERQQRQDSLFKHVSCLDCHIPSQSNNNGLLFYL